SAGFLSAKMNTARAVPAVPPGRAAGAPCESSRFFAKRHTADGGLTRVPGGCDAQPLIFRRPPARQHQTAMTASGVTATAVDLLKQIVPMIQAVVFDTKPDDRGPLQSATP